MKVIIPAAGFGSRLRPHTFTTPKILLPVAGRPIVAHILDQVIAAGADEINIIVGHLGEQVRKWVGENYDIPVEYCEQPEMLGLAHAVLMGLKPDDEDVLIILGDSILGMDLNSAVKLRSSAIGVKEVEDPRRFGVVVVENGKVVKMVEKPTELVSHLAIVGVYYIKSGATLHKAIVDIMDSEIKVKGEFQITDALQTMVDWGEDITTFSVQDWYDCGKPDALLQTNRYLFDSGKVASRHPEPKDGTIIPPVSIAPDVRIEKSVVGPYVSIGSGSVIRNSIVRDTIIGDDACLERSIVDESLIGNRAYVSGSFEKINVGQSSQIGIKS
ncbi:sugar phosphate nucleotidyltransferase [Calditrichota bacterium]